jgi:tetratricopeptide (TPR) repeat protein
MRYGRLGQLHQVHALWSQAEACYRNAVLLDGGAQVRWRYLLAVTLQMQGRPQDAASELSEVVARFPDEPAAVLRLAQLELDRGNADPASALFARALELDPANATARVGLGRALLDLGRPADALPHLLRAIEMQPAATRVHHLIARAYRAQGDRDAVARHLALAGDRDVVSRDALLDEMQSLAAGSGSHLRRGDAAMLAGNPAEAVESYARAVELSPEDASARHSLAAALVKSGRQQEGRKEYEESLRLDPQGVDVMLSLAALDLRDGDAPSAVRRLRRAVEIAPDLGEARVRLAVALTASGASEEALEQLDDALRRDPANVAAAAEKASVLSALGRHDEAIELLARVVATDPRLSSLERRLADLLAAQGRYSVAQAHYQAVVANQPGDVDTRLRLATASTLAGRYEAAIETLEAGLEVGARRPEIVHALATLLATCPDDRLRDGARSLALAREALADQATVERAETVALALAQVGDFEQAVEWQSRILAQLGEQEGSPLGVRLRSNLDRYRRRERGLAPWQSSPPPAGR